MGTTACSVLLAIPVPGVLPPPMYNIDLILYCCCTAAQVYCYAIAPPDGSEWWGRVVRGADHVADLSGLSAPEVRLCPPFVWGWSGFVVPSLCRDGVLGPQLLCRG